MSPQLGDLDLPPGLDKALVEGRLVVFAGAGVSAQPPSGLPKFDDLAAQIGAGSNSRREGEALEVYLGRLASEGVHVNQIANQTLSDTDSQPNDLHRACVGLWRSAEDVRIVTTNFDLHFESALKERWPAGAPDLWSAPALPVGSSFNGLVYLHGRLGRPDRLVLTDIDFGRAYLTEGWARRFLTALFERYVVLFVGYSHKDTILGYLARGLSPTRTGGRFALTDEAEPSRWRLLGIEPIPYDPAEDHAAVLKGLQRWGALRSGGALEHQDRIALCCAAPPIDREDADYLLWCIERPSLAQFFTRAAHGIEWIEWLHSEGRLLPLLSASETGERELLLLHWFSREFCANEHAIERSLILLATARFPLSPPAFHALAGALWRRVEGSRGEAGALDQSTAKASLFLLSMRPVNLRENAIDYLLNAVPAEFPDLALSLFDELTRPLLQLDAHSYVPRDEAGPRTSADIAVQADGNWIYPAWEGALKKCLPTKAQQVLTIARHHLEHADRQMRASGQSELFDNLSFSRHRLSGDEEKNEQPLRSHYPFYVLIDAARDAFAWLTEHEPAQAARGLLDWSFSPAVLAQRVAMHGLSRTAAVSGDEKLRLIVERDWLDSPTVGMELFALLESAYAGAASQQRRSFLDHLREVRLGELVRVRSEDEHRLWKVERYSSTLAWIQKRAPDCDLVRERIEEVRRVYPELEVREPEERPRTGFRREARATRYSVTEMHEWAAEEFLRRLREERAAKRNSWDSDPVAGFLEEGAKAVAANFEWGLGLAQALVKETQAPPVFWSYIIRGWGTARLAAGHWQEATSFLEQNLQQLADATEVAELLERRVEGDPEEIPDEVIRAGASLARALWKAPSSAETEGNQLGDWLTTAINRPAGKLALFVIRAISVLRKRHGDGWPKAVPGLEELLHDLASRDATQTPLARVVLCGHLPFLHDLDPEWARATVIPLFDWGDPEEARRSWSGFLVVGRPTRGLWPQLKDLMRAAFDHLAELKTQERRFAEFVAASSLFCMTSDFDQAWLQAFVRAASWEARRSFADHLGGFLRGMAPEATDRAWKSWIGGYLAARLAGKPPLEEGEWASMQRWVIYLSNAFEEAVDVVRARPAKFEDSVLILHELGKSSSALGPPSALARFLLHVLNGQKRPMFECEDVLAICRRIGRTGDSHLERALQERFVELGCSGTLFPKSD